MKGFIGKAANTLLKQVRKSFWTHRREDVGCAPRTNAAVMVRGAHPTFLTARMGSDTRPAALLLTKKKGRTI